MCSALKKNIDLLSRSWEHIPLISEALAQWKVRQRQMRCRADTRIGAGPQSVGRKTAFLEWHSLLAWATAPSQPVQQHGQQSLKS